MWINPSIKGVRLVEENGKEGEGGGSGAAGLLS